MTPQPDRRRPVIGIAATVRTIDLPYASFRAHTAFDHFVARVGAAGGLPVILPLDEDDRVRDLVAAVDGLLLTGGVDLHPDLYGGVAVPRPLGGPYDLGRDRSEIAMAHAARAVGKPVLGVCRGMHVLNVAAGGTLVEHVDGHLDIAVRHAVAVEPTSTLSRIVGASVDTGSLHHQAVGRVGAGLRIAGRSPDGVVEAIEASDDARVLGVQWHPELETGGAGDPLWRWLVLTAGAKR